MGYYSITFSRSSIIVQNTEYSIGVSVGKPGRGFDAMTRKIVIYPGYRCGVNMHGNLPAFYSRL